ncbi:CRISPR-associated endonuclease Cas3'' [Endomicrobium proavitum]|uniref:CRISPR-associated endonuclease Cas3'' n=1 Tax=Endomicrobium proavitum TaxID=1408281 RepID=UPI000696A6C5|nr:CRISPR-associated endonuclease Cas3'' [Endomicrobium proavitum]
MSEEFYARYSQDGKRKQFLKEHLKVVSCIAMNNAEKIGLADFGKYLGLLHDLGKYQNAFQKYLANGGKRGSVHHAPVGAIHIFEKIKELNIKKDRNLTFLAEVLALCITSHHTNLIDMLDISGSNKFEKRITKQDDINLKEAIDNVDLEIKTELKNIDFKILSKELKTIIDKISQEQKTIPKHFYLGMLAKYLLSCLIDADHTDSANFELQAKADLRQDNQYISWEMISKQLEKSLQELNVNNKSADNVKNVRKQISDNCLNAGRTFAKGCYKLEVPTGGGKTLASFRFAVEMAKQHKADRIIYAIPYTTIIEQNAETIRKIVEIDETYKGKIVLEHHSNLSHKNKTEEEIDLNEMYLKIGMLQ